MQGPTPPTRQLGSFATQPRNNACIECWMRSAAVALGDRVFSIPNVRHTALGAASIEGDKLVVSACRQGGRVRKLWTSSLVAPLGHAAGGARCAGFFSWCRVA